MQAIKEKYKEDKQRQQQEIMNFYREHKINPLASCLPLLLQLPVFISLFYMLRTDLKKHICGSQLVGHYNQLHHTAILKVSELPGKYIGETSCQTVAHGSGKFLFLHDITNKATGVALVVLILLYVGSQLGSTLVATATADPNQRRLFLVLPIVFIVFLYRFPAGLLVYWITTNLWTIGQQLVIRRYMGTAQAPAGKAGPGKRPGAGGGPAADGKGPSPGGGGPKGGGPKGEPELVTAGASARSAPPPRPPRKKKKRSGRRR
jgi:YidC/Oxa1 family membrane protein insertase